MSCAPLVSSRCFIVVLISLDFYTVIANSTNENYANKQQPGRLLRVQRPICRTRFAFQADGNLDCIVVLPLGLNSLRLAIFGLIML